MRRAIDRMRPYRRTRRRTLGLPRMDVLSLIEIGLLALLMIQIARLVWAIATPVGAYGEWRGRSPIIPGAPARTALFSSFDPFFRTAQPGAQNQVVTSLALTLYGIRLNEGSGLGSAIIATPDGVQSSFAVGDEILPGVTLKAVAFDHVVISRGGADETLFLDQSQTAPVAQPGGMPSAVPPIANGGPQQPAASSILTPMTLKSDIGFSPRNEGGRVTGLILTAKGPAYQAAGFLPGDIMIQVNGRAIASLADLQAVQGQMVPGARLSLLVERGASTVPIALTLQGP